MKKIIGLFLGILLMVGMFSGVSFAVAEVTNRVLVVYYSLTGTTEGLAERIVEATGGDLYVLEPATPYADSTEDVGRVMQAERDSGTIRDLTDTLPDLSGYDTVLIGGPVWSGLPSNPVQKYLSLTDFGGKTVSGFWSASSSPADYANAFKALVSNGDVKDGLSIVAADFSDDAALDAKIADWLRAAGIS